MKKQLVQVELIVDIDGPMATFYRWNYTTAGRLVTSAKLYRARSLESPAAKARFINRVHALQMALCKAA